MSPDEGRWSQPLLTARPIWRPLRFGCKIGPVSSALHAVLTALLWLSRGLWPTGAGATDVFPADSEAHACRCDPPAQDLGTTPEPCEPVEIEDEDDDTPPAAVTRAPPLSLEVPDLRATCRRGSASSCREICMAGAGSIRGPPETCPFGQVPKTL